MSEKRETPQARYDKVNTKMYGIKVVLSTERDIYEKLESIPNRSGYIKELIREDLAKESPQ